MKAEIGDVQQNSVWGHQTLATCQRLGAEPETGSPCIPPKKSTPPTPLSCQEGQSNPEEREQTGAKNKPRQGEEKQADGTDRGSPQDLYFVLMSLLWVRARGIIRCMLQKDDSDYSVKSGRTREWPGGREMGCRGPGRTSW